MIQVTPRAAAKLTELSGGNLPVVRLSVKGRTCCGFLYGLSFVDEIDPDSAVSESHGVRLVADPQTAAACQGFQVDYVQTPECAGFSVRDPDTPPGCGCGGQGRS